MRQTGKTTRLIDSAIQYLFIYGYIRILTNSEIYNKDFMRGFKPNQVDMFLKFIDPDTKQDNKAQHYFIEALNRRIYVEHRDSVERISRTEFKVISR